jgi:hypothetical protein
MRGKNLEAEEENFVTIKERINHLALYHFNFSENNCAFDESDFRSLFEVTFGPVFIGSTKESLREEEIK